MFALLIAILETVSISLHQSQFKLASQEVERYEKEYSELGNIDYLNDRRTELQEKMRVNRNKLSDFRVRAIE